MSGVRRREGETESAVEDLGILAGSQVWFVGLVTKWMKKPYLFRALAPRFRNEARLSGTSVFGGDEAMSAAQISEVWSWVFSLRPFGLSKDMLREVNLTPYATRHFLCDIARCWG